MSKIIDTINATSIFFSIYEVAMSMSFPHIIWL